MTDRSRRRFVIAAAGAATILGLGWAGYLLTGSESRKAKVSTLTATASSKTTANLQFLGGLGARINAMDNAIETSLNVWNMESLHAARDATESFAELVNMLRNDFDAIKQNLGMGWVEWKNRSLTSEPRDYSSSIASRYRKIMEDNLAAFDSSGETSFFDANIDLANRSLGSASMVQSALHAAARITEDWEWNNDVESAHSGMGVPPGSENIRQNRNARSVVKNIHSYYLDPKDDESPFAPVAPTAHTYEIDPRFVTRLGPLLETVPAFKGIVERDATPDGLTELSYVLSILSNPSMVDFPSALTKGIEVQDVRSLHDAGMLAGGLMQFGRPPVAEKGDLSKLVPDYKKLTTVKLFDRLTKKRELTKNEIGAYLLFAGRPVFIRSFYYDPKGPGFGTAGVSKGPCVRDAGGTYWVIGYVVQGMVGVGLRAQSLIDYFEWRKSRAGNERFVIMIGEKYLAGELVAKNPDETRVFLEYP